MKISIRMLTLGSEELFFLYNHKQQPVIDVRGKQYANFGELYERYPQLGQKENIGALAQITNFFAKGIEFQFIENIEQFKENYYQRIEADQSSLLYEGSALKDFGIFDLSLMHPPILKGDRLTFFVKHDYLELPYQATVRYPIVNGQLEVSYELLPIKTQ